MLIAIDASRANRSHKSGTEWYSYYLIRWFAKLDKKNQYILYSDVPLRDGLADLTTEQDFSSVLSKNGNEPEFDKDGYQVIKSPYNNFRSKVLRWPYRYLWTQGRLSFEMLFNKPDVLFVPAHTLPVIHPARSIVTIHDIGFAHNSKIYDSDSEIGPESRMYKKILKMLIRLLTFGKCGVSSVEYLDWSTRFGLEKTSKVITISDFSRRDIIDMYGEKYSNKLKVISNGYSKSLYKKIDNKEKLEKILNKYNIDGEYFFYIGRLEKKKNIELLIKSFAKLRDRNKNIKQKLVLAGDAGFGYNDINYLISDRGVEEDVIMTGWVDESDVPYLYSGASAFIFPSNYEGFGIPLLQSMACGVPVIASNVTSIPEVVGDAALLFDVADPEALVDVIECLMEDEKLRTDLIEKGYNRVDMFSWERCARETLNEILTE